VVIAFTVAMGVATKKMAPFSAVILGTVISMAAFAILAMQSSVIAVYVTLVVVALGEIIQAPRYYDYISRLAPPGQQGTYMGFAFLPIGIGSLIGGWFGGRVMHRFAEVAHQPQTVWWAISAVGMLTALLLWIYDRIVRPSRQEPTT
jgi:predicted MFS family arabinose efflux permease